MTQSNRLILLLLLLSAFVLVLTLVSFGGESYQADGQVVIFLQREGFTDDEIAEFMILPRFPNIEHGQLTAGKQLSIRQDLRVAVLFDVFLSDSTDESWGCYTSTIIYDYCGTNDKEKDK